MALEYNNPLPMLKHPSQALLRAGGKLSPDKMDRFLRHLVRQHIQDSSHPTTPAIARALCATCIRDGQHAMTALEEAAVLAALTQGVRGTHVQLGGAYFSVVTNMLTKISDTVSKFLDRPVGTRRARRRQHNYYPNLQRPPLQNQHIGHGARRMEQQPTILSLSDAPIKHTNQSVPSTRGKPSQTIQRAWPPLRTAGVSPGTLSRQPDTRQRHYPQQTPPWNASTQSRLSTRTNGRKLPTHMPEPSPAEALNNEDLRLMLNAQTLTPAQLAKYYKNTAYMDELPMSRRQ